MGGWGAEKVSTFPRVYFDIGPLAEGTYTVEKADVLVGYDIRDGSSVPWNTVDGIFRAATTSSGSDLLKIDNIPETITSTDDDGEEITLTQYVHQIENETFVIGPGG